MVGMTDPMEALKNLQVEVGRGLRFQPCELNSNMGVYMDQPNGRTRLSYAIIEGEVVKALSLFVAIDPEEGVPCFTAGYAVAEGFRNNGLATTILQNSIAELKYGLGKNRVKRFYIDAIIGLDNIASQKVASKVISTKQEKIVDCYSGNDAYRYLRLMEVE